MTIYEKIMEMDEEELAEFLYRFSRDVLNGFEHFIMPDKDRIRGFLEKELDKL